VKLRMSCNMSLELPFHSSLNRLEKWLRKTDHYRSLIVLGRDWKRLKFRSKEDFVLCRLCPDQVDHCVAFYEGRGDSLRDLLTREEISELDTLLVRTLEKYYQYFQRFRAVREGWTWYDCSQLLIRIREAA